jgi:hypothetical protein
MKLTPSHSETFKAASVDLCLRTHDPDSHLPKHTATRQRFGLSLAILPTRCDLLAGYMRETNATCAKRLFKG